MFSTNNACPIRYYCRLGRHKLIVLLDRLVWQVVVTKKLTQSHHERRHFGIGQGRGLLRPEPEALGGFEVVAEEGDYGGVARQQAGAPLGEASFH